MADLVATFRQPFPEQVAALRLRLGELRPTYGSADPSYSGFERAFMVAGATKADLLADLAAAVDRAVTEGAGFEAFKRDFRSIVEKRGWHGWTGEGTAKGEEWRMRTIYRTNIRTTYAAGRHAQLTAGNFKFWVYKHSGSRHPRLNHLSWDGIGLPPDHPFWAKHYPPNGWGCDCRVVGTNSKRGIARVGGDPDKVLPDDWDALDPRTGAPTGIGKGWDSAPASSTDDLVTAMAQKVVDWPVELGTAYTEQLPDGIAMALGASLRQLPSTATDTRRYAERVLGERGGAPITDVIVEPQKTFGPADAATVERIRAATGRDVTRTQFLLDQAGIRASVDMSGDVAAESSIGGRAIRVQSFEHLPLILDDPDRIEMGERSATGQQILRFMKIIGAAEFTVGLELQGVGGRTLAVRYIRARDVSGAAPA